MKKLILLLPLIAMLFFIKVNNASAQGCTTTPPANTGTVTLSTTTTAGTYKVWTRMKAADTSNNSFYLKVDSGCAILVGDNNQISASTWTWVDYQNGITTNKINVTLTAGNHVITLIGNEPGVSVDKVLLTKNLTCIPVNNGDNCPTELPTPTPTVGAISTPTPTIQAPSGQQPLTVSSAYSDGGFAWAIDRNFGTTPDSSANSSASVLRVFENGVELGPPHSAHVDIRNLGLGRFSHKAGSDGIETLRFSASDNSNPKTNGRTYTYSIGGSPTLTLIPTITPTLQPTNTPIPTPTKTPTPTPTNVPTPTPTPPITAAPQETILKFTTVKLHGIGTGGDNTNPNISGNTNPLTLTRLATVELYNTSGALVSTVQGNIVYSANVGYFLGDIKLDSSVPAGSYLIKVKSDRYLKKQLSGIITIVKGTTMQMPPVALVTGDSNMDGILSILDYNVIIGCYSDLLPPKNCDATKKVAADISDDGKVNQDDYNLFLREFSVISGD